jgi:hypothetical protein
LLFLSLIVLPGLLSWMGAFPAFVALFVVPLAVLPVLQLSGMGSAQAVAWAWPLGSLIVLAVVSSQPAFIALGLTYGLVVVLPAVSVEAWLRWRWSDGRWVALTALAGLGLSLAVALVAAAPEAPLEAARQWLEEPLQQVEATYTELGMRRSEVQMGLDEMRRWLVWILPAMPVIYLIAILFFVRPRLPLLGVDVHTVAFEQYSSDEWLPAVFAAAGVGTLLTHGTLRWVAVNVLVTVVILYFIHGLAIIRAYVGRWVGRGWLVRWGVVLLCLQFPLPLVVAVLGMTDAFRSLRPAVSSQDDSENESG